MEEKNRSGFENYGTRVLFSLTLAAVLFSISGCFETNGVGKGLSLNGNVDNRQMNISYLISERIGEVKAEEGDRVRKGDLLGTLETVRIENQVAEAEADVAASKAAVQVAKEAILIAEKASLAADAGAQAAEAEYEKAENGSRKEDIALAEAGVEIFDVQIPAAKNYYERNLKLAHSSAVSEQEFENAESEYRKLEAQKKLAERNLEKYRNGTREEEKAMAKASMLQAQATAGQMKAQHEQSKAQLVQAEANLARAEAILKIRKQTLADCQLFAPCDGIIRSRILEPGELASPQMPAFTLAVISPKWIRVYVEEPDLPRIKMGGKAEVRMDGREEGWEGWVGFISPNAEFTPKSVETRELRTSLVYEVRVFVKDEDDILKLGAPVSVLFNE
ncbi:MAG: efflux RND transporter periplasmic adaptor subunit [Thermoguttaceae bacterium]|nr:efflux RND transporter periplasmic adaptor subunit [Thermoguttaceae bacterium]